MGYRYKINEIIIIIIIISITIIIIINIITIMHIYAKYINCGMQWMECTRPTYPTRSIYRARKT